MTDKLIPVLDSLEITSGDKKREEYLEWNEYFMAVSFLSAMRSKDPATQVGTRDVHIMRVGLVVVTICRFGFLFQSSARICWRGNTPPPGTVGHIS